jgi:hypothetical protein
MESTQEPPGRMAWKLQPSETMEKAGSPTPETLPTFAVAFPVLLITPFIEPLVVNTVWLLN